MAGDWIKLRTGIFNDPDVLKMSDMCRTNRHQIVGQVSDVWCWIGGHSMDGLCPNVSKSMIDAYVGTQGFADALESIGWLEPLGEGVQFPKWDRHNSNNAKARGLESEAKKLRRTNVGQMSDGCRTKPAQNVRPEKRREEKIKLPHTPKGEDADFDKFWSAYPKRRGRASAVKAWAKAVKVASVQTIIAAVEKQKLDPDWTKDRGKYIPHPASWLNAERWKDELQIELPVTTTSTTSRPFTPEDWA